jgi:arylsulfatase A
LRIGGFLHRRNFLKTFSLGLSSIVTVSGCSNGKVRGDKRPNIILIMADDLGYECLSCNGGQSYKTPRLDQMAKTGMRFEHCYSQPLCTPSRVQIMTGRYNHRNYKSFGYLGPKEITFANLLKDARYTTCVAGKWQLNGVGQWPNWHDRDRATHFGFDEYCLWNYTKLNNDKQSSPKYCVNFILL